MMSIYFSLWFSDGYTIISQGKSRSEFELEGYEILLMLTITVSFSADTQVYQLLLFRDIQ